MITFNHSGKIGDILYSLYFCKSLSEYNKFNKFNFHIQTNVIENSPFEQSNIRLSNMNAELLLDLLKSQDYINEVNISDDIPNNSFNLDNFRFCKINTMAGHIPNYYFNLVNFHLERNFEKPIINVSKNDFFKDKILITFTERYNNININLKYLNKFKDYLIFIGTENEFQRFKTMFFNLEYYKSKNFLDLAKIITGCKMLIGNQGGIFSLAECIKCKRILMSPEILQLNDHLMFGPVNNNLQGGWFDYAISNEKLVSLIEENI